MWEEQLWPILKYTDLHLEEGNEGSEKLMGADLCLRSLDGHRENANHARHYYADSVLENEKHHTKPK
jgi:hypothetical protein